MPLSSHSGKVLALELLKILLENSGPTFRRGERFLTAIRQYLCLSLLKNNGSPLPAAQVGAPPGRQPQPRTASAWKGDGLSFPAADRPPLSLAA